MNMTYKDLKLRKYLKLLELLEEQSDYDELHLQASIIAVLNDMTEEEVLALKISEYGNKVKESQFIFKAPDVNNRCPDKVVLNGHKYHIVKDPRKLTAGQFIDFETFMNEENRYKYLPNILACFIMPEGKEYGEYDALEVSDMIADYMNVEEALQICGFFRKQSLVCTRLTLRFLEERLKKEMRREKNPELKMKLKEAMTKMKEYKDFIKNGTGFIG